MEKEIFNKKIDSKIEKFDHEKIAGIFKKIAADYESFFLEQGFQSHESVNMVAAKIDPSVVFIGSTISALKPIYLSDQIPVPGVIIFQPSIRTHNSKNLYSEQPNKGNTFFNLIGGLAPGDKFKDICALSLGFFKEKLGIKQERIFIRVSSIDKDIVSFLESLENCPDLEYDGRAKSYYRWQYGIKNVLGRGIAFAIRNEEDEKKSITLGNVILMESTDHKPAVQWGFGMESIISGIYNKGKVIEGSLISQVIPYEKFFLPKFADSLAVVIEMFNLGLMPDNRGAASYLKQYLKGLAFWRKRLNINEPLLKKYISDYCQLRKISASEQIIQNIIEGVKIHDKNVSDLIEYVKKIGSSDKSGYKIIELSNKFKLHPDEIALIIKNL